MTVFLDTNVLIDVIVGREPFLDDSKAVLTLCGSSPICVGEMKRKGSCEIM